MRWLRDWLGWAVTWTLVIQTPMWVAVGVEAWRERTDPTLDARPVDSWVPHVAYVAAVLVPVALLLVVLGTRSVLVRRAGLLLGAVGFAAGAIAFSGFPQGDVGTWYVGLTALAGGGALVAALTPAGKPGDSPPVRLAGLALVCAGVFAAWTCWRGASFWYWRIESGLVYEVGLGLSALLVLLGATIARWGALQNRMLRWVLLLSGAAGALVFLAGLSILRELAVLYRWDEHEPAWMYATPLLLMGAGAVAAAVSVSRRRADLVAWSLAAGITLSLISLWQESTWGSVMG